MNRIVFATGNKNKLKEVAMILADLDMEVISIKDAGVDLDVVEDGCTYADNALIKVREAHRLLPDDIVMADDSGFEVDCLNKEPGVYSARYMGEETSYDIKNQNLIDRAAHAEGDERGARFVCAIAAVLPDGTEQVSIATMEGKISKEIRGTNGFGYDPILWLDEYGCTSAELSPEQKNEISHRGKALQAAREKLLAVL